MITHGMTFWNCVNLGPIDRASPHDAVTLTVLPLFHTGGLNCYCNPALHAGGTRAADAHVRSGARAAS